MQILNSSISGKKKTELMRDVGLSYLQAKLYLSELVERGLLQIDEGRNFKTTKKGMEFLEKCEACPLFEWNKEKLKSLI